LEEKALSDINLTPTSGMVKEAQRGLDWRKEFGRGGTDVGISRARDIVNGKDMSVKTVKRMYSFFSRHEVDKKGKGFKRGSEGYPSNGRIAWALWGGDAGFSWSTKKRNQIKKEEEKNMCEQCENKDLQNEIKSLNAQVEKPNKKGEFVFTASSERTDREGDVIKSSGWLLDNFKDGGVLLWGHNQDKLPVGRVLWVKQDNGKLVGKARFNGQTQLSKDVEKLVKMGDLTGISVGFRALESEKTQHGRMFTKQELLEVSVVNVPANPDAVIHTIKSLDIESDAVKLACYKSMKVKVADPKNVEKETIAECVDRKIPIIADENPEMDQDQVVAIANNMCEEEVKDVAELEEKVPIGDGRCQHPWCPKNRPKKGVLELPEIDLDSIIEIKTRLEKIEKVLKEKENKESGKNMEADLRKKKTEMFIRRAVSKYLQNRK
jgi:HK97 family phage prohead protease